MHQKVEECVRILSPTYKTDYTDARKSNVP